MLLEPDAMGTNRHCFGSSFCSWTRMLQEQNVIQLAAMDALPIELSRNRALSSCLRGLLPKTSTAIAESVNRYSDEQKCFRVYSA